MFTTKHAKLTVPGILSTAFLSLVLLHPSPALAQPVFAIDDNDFVLNDRDLVIRDSANRVLFRFDKDLGDIRILDSQGETVVLIQRRGRNLFLGGQGRAGDVVLLPRDATSQDLTNASVHIDGSDGTQRLGGGGTDGQLVLRDRQGRQRILLNGQTATLTLGQEGSDGNIFVRNAAGEPMVTLDGDSGRVRAKIVSSSAFTSNSDLIFEAPMGTERARIKEADGNFGIGTAFPGRRLHVVGDVLIQNGELLCTPAPGLGVEPCINENNVAFGVPPIGSIIAWHPNIPGLQDELPDAWAECNGQVITEQNHPGSPLVNATMPNLNGFRESEFKRHGNRRFLRGGSKSESGEMEDDQVGRHDHKIDTFSSGFDETHVNRGSSGNIKGQALTAFDTDNKENRPANMSVVWIMRVK